MNISLPTSLKSFVDEQVSQRGFSTSSEYMRMKTPYDKLKSLPEADTLLKPGITFEQLDAIALTISDNEAAKQMNEAKRKLFMAIFEQNKKVG